MSGFHLTVIAKQPVPGRVKTRLVPPLTYEQAASIAAACLVDTFNAVTTFAERHADVRPVALIDGEAGGWVPRGFDVHHQSDGDLGERLANGFEELGPGLIIGMDTPSVGPHFDAVFDALRDGADAIGMTLDGGYWGIGLATVDAAVFDGVPMSTDRTGAAQLDRLHELGRAVNVAPTVHDLDEFADIAAIVAATPGSHLATAAASLVGPGWG